MSQVGIANVGGAAAAGAGFPLLPAIGIGAGLISGLFGSKKKPPSAGTIGSLFGTGALSKDTLSLYNFLANSPQFSNVLSKNRVAGQQFSGNLTSALANRGLTTSGIGTIAQTMGGSATAFGENALRGGLFGQAGNMAESNLMARLQAWAGLQGQSMGQPNFLQSFGASLLGAGGTSLLGR